MSASRKAPAREQAAGTVRVVGRMVPDAPVALFAGACLVYDDSPSVLMVLQQGPGTIVEISMSLDDAQRMANMLLRRAESLHDARRVELHP